MSWDGFRIFSRYPHLHGAKQIVQKNGQWNKSKINFFYMLKLSLQSINELQLLFSFKLISNGFLRQEAGIFKSPRFTEVITDRTHCCITHSILVTDIITKSFRIKFNSLEHSLGIEQKTVS